MRSLGLLAMVLCAYGRAAEPVVVYIQFDDEPGTTVAGAARKELEAIVTAAGAGFEWHPLAESLGKEISPGAAVLTFRGRCDVRDLGRGTYSGSLGRSARVDGVILPFPTVDCDAVRRYVQRDLLMLGESQREAALGRALGRVAAHELYHVIGKTWGHAECGVGKATYTVRDLLGERFRLEICRSSPGN
jgi:hypothetical protein